MSVAMTIFLLRLVVVWLGRSEALPSGFRPSALSSQIAVPSLQHDLDILPHLVARVCCC